MLPSSHPACLRGYGHVGYNIPDFEGHIITCSASDREGDTDRLLLLASMLNGIGTRESSDDGKLVITRPWLIGTHLRTL